MLSIKKIILHNFKRFKDITLNLNPDINMFIGDNESGKSTILQAIDLVARGSRKRVENIGLDRLFNIDTINEFMKDRTLNNLPEMYVELYFSEQNESSLCGINNSKKTNCSGVILRCSINDDFCEQVANLLKKPDASFPIEFYKIEFTTFAGESFNAYTKKLKSLFIDNSIIGSPFAMRDYVNEIYHSQLSDEERVNNKHAYKDSKIQFQNEVLKKYNSKIRPYSFAIRESSDNNIETDITLLENDIPLENKGTGTQCFIKTKLSMDKAVNNIDVVLIEEPENHLSYTKMLELINIIKRAENRQLFISTHCDLIATRLNLKKCLLFNSRSENVVSLDKLSEETADFFIKAPDNNMLQFVLSPKSILVEGDAEFILMEAFYKKIFFKDLSDSGIGVIVVGGRCFKRYLEIAKILGNKVAVITDNDGNYDENIKKYYSEYFGINNIGIYSDDKNASYTFEVCVYRNNKTICDDEFNSPKRRLSTEEYMLKNKTEVAYKILKNKADKLVVPKYIQEAIEWIGD